MLRDRTWKMKTRDGWGGGSFRKSLKQELSERTMSIIGLLGWHVLFLVNGDDAHFTLQWKSILIICGIQTCWYIYSVFVTTIRSKSFQTRIDAGDEKQVTGHEMCVLLVIMLFLKAPKYITEVLSTVPKPRQWWAFRKKTPRCTSLGYKL